MVCVGGRRDSVRPRSSVSRAAVGARFTRKCRAFIVGLLRLFGAALERGAANERHAPWSLRHPRCGRSFRRPVLGFPDAVVGQGTQKELLADYGLDGPGIAERILNL